MKSLENVSKKRTYIYRIKYIPLNMYYKPPRKNNPECLSNEGKWYTEYPKDYDLTSIQHNNEIISTVPEDWLIEKYHIQLDKKEKVKQLKQ